MRILDKKITKHNLSGALSEYFVLKDDWRWKYEWFYYRYNQGKAFFGPLIDILQIIGIGGFTYIFLEMGIKTGSKIAIIFIPIWLIFFYTIGYLRQKFGMVGIGSEISGKINNLPIQRIENKIDKLLKVK